MSVVPYNNNGNAGKPGPQGFGSGNHGPSQMYGPPIKEKGPSMSTVLADNITVAKAKTFRTTNMEVDIAVVKATTPKFAVVPKEKHVRTLKRACHGGGLPGSMNNTNYVIQKLMERLHATKHWLCALKVLMVFHRLMRESEGSSFISTLGHFGDMRGYGGYGNRGGALNMDNFSDNTSGDGRFDYSEWVRCYARYLDEQLSVFIKTAFYQEADGAAPAEGKMRTLPPAELLLQLPPLQKLLERLMETMPRGAAARSYVVQAALLTVAKESFQIYRTISEGIINLADCFFDMAYDEAKQGLDIYKQHTSDNDKLGNFYAEAEKIEELRRSATFPKLTPPSPDFLGLMEDYVNNAPRDGKAKSPSRDTGDKLPTPVDSGLTLEEEAKQEPEPELEPEPEPEPAPAPTPEMDLLNFDEPDAEPVPPPPPREKTATELLEAEKSQENTPTVSTAATANGFGSNSSFNGANGFNSNTNFGHIPQQSNNPFGNGASSGQQQQPQPQGGPGGGAVVPLASAFAQGPAGQGWGGQPHPSFYQGAQYGMQNAQPGGYGMQTQASYGVQPGQMVPYGNPGLTSPGQYGGQPSPMSNYSQTPGGTTPGAAGAAQQASSFKNAALADPFAELGPVAPPQAHAQQTPPLREVSPTQQRINLGSFTQAGSMQPQNSGMWAGQPMQQMQQWAPQQQQQQQQQQNGWGQPQHQQQPLQGQGMPHTNSYNQFQQGALSPQTPQQLQGGWQR